MATQAQMDRLIGRALFSDEFRALLLANPEKAASSLRIRLDSAQAERIRQIDPASAAELAGEFQKLIGGRVHGIGFW